MAVTVDMAADTATVTKQTGGRILSRFAHRTNLWTCGVVMASGSFDQRPFLCALVCVGSAVRTVKRVAVLSCVSSFE